MNTSMETDRPRLGAARTIPATAAMGLVVWYVPQWRMDFMVPLAAVIYFTLLALLDTFDSGDFSMLASLVRNTPHWCPPLPPETTMMITITAEYRAGLGRKAPSIRKEPVPPRSCPMTRVTPTNITPRPNGGKEHSP